MPTWQRVLVGMWIGGVGIGALAFALGFFGPMLLMSGSPQGPLIAIATTPIGVIVGVAVGAIAGWRRGRALTGAP